MTQLEISSKDLLEALEILRSAVSKKSFPQQSLVDSLADIIIVADQVSYLSQDNAINIRKLVEENIRLRNALGETTEALDDIELDEYFES